MAYKKYIKKGGKVYGPYLYHSKRIDGKVVSEYHGSEKPGKKTYGKFLLVFLGVFLLVTLFYLVGSPEKSITGNAILELDANYEKGQPLDGKVKLFLEEGDKVSNSSKIVFENNGNYFEYNLLDFTEGEILPEEIFPVVNFKLNILSRENVENNSNETQTNGISDFIENLVGTGNAIVEFETEIEGSVSAEEKFIYVLSEGERAELKPRSAKTRLKQLPDNILEIKTEGNEVFVTTDYFEIEEGSNEILIELSELDLVFEEGNLAVSLVENGEVISFTEIVFGEKTQENTQPEIPEDIILPETKPEEKTILNETNTTSTVSETFGLTTEERAILLEKFGSTTVEVTEATSKNGFIIIKYEIDNFWIENSYSEDLDAKTLEKFMEEDRVKWLKDVAKKLSEDETLEKEIPEFLGNVSV